MPKCAQHWMEMSRNYDTQGHTLTEHQTDDVL